MGSWSVVPQSLVLNNKNSTGLQYNQILEAMIITVICIPIAIEIDWEN